MTYLLKHPPAVARQRVDARVLSVGLQKFGQTATTRIVN